MKYEYKTSGVCSSKITFVVEDGIVKKVVFTGGCAGYATAMSKIVQGMKVEDVIKMFKGIKCGSKPTSCPDQLAKALQAASKQKK